jgi:hypothetical protein
MPVFITDSLSVPVTISVTFGWPILLDLTEPESAAVAWPRVGIRANPWLLVTAN